MIPDPTPTPDYETDRAARAKARYNAKKQERANLAAENAKLRTVLKLIAEWCEEEKSPFALSVAKTARQALLS